MSCGPAINILLVEDSRADAFLVTDILENLGLCVQVTRARDGAQAIDMLLNHDGRSRPPPDMVILDLNLPKLSGFEVLSQMKNRNELSKVPVVVVTGSLNKDDEIRARNMGVTNYLLKPAGGEEYDTFSRWFSRELTKLSARRKRSDRSDQCASMLGGSLGWWPRPPSMHVRAELVSEMSYFDSPWAMGPRL